MNQSKEFMLQSGSLLAGSEQHLAAFNHLQLQLWNSAFTLSLAVCKFSGYIYNPYLDKIKKQEKEFSKFNKITSSASAAPNGIKVKNQFLFKASSIFNPIGNWWGFAARQIDNANHAMRVVLAPSVIKNFRKKILSYSFGKQDAISSVEHFSEMGAGGVFLNYLYLIIANKAKLNS